MTTEITKVLRQSAVKSTCLRTGKSSWWIRLGSVDFVVTKGGFRGPREDISDASIKNTRKELISCILHFYSNEELKEMIAV
jgi:hypothetical protein